MFPHFSTPPQKRKRREGERERASLSPFRPLFLVYTKGACGRFRAPVSEEWWPGLSVNIWQVHHTFASFSYFESDFESRKLCNESTLRGHAAMSLLDRGIMSDFVRGSRRCCGLLGINPP